MDCVFVLVFYWYLINTLKLCGHNQNSMAIGHTCWGVECGWHRLYPKIYPQRHNEGDGVLGNVLLWYWYGFEGAHSRKRRRRRAGGKKQQDLNTLCNVTENKVWKNNVTVNDKTKATRGGGNSLFFFMYSLWWIFSNDQMSTKNSDPQYKRMYFEHWKKTSSQFWTIYIFDILV